MKPLVKKLKASPVVLSACVRWTVGSVALPLATVTLATATIASVSMATPATAQTEPTSEGQWSKDEGYEDIPSYRSLKVNLDASSTQDKWVVPAVGVDKSQWYYFISVDANNKALSPTKKWYRVTGSGADARFEIDLKNAQLHDSSSRVLIVDSQGNLVRWFQITKGNSDIKPPADKSEEVTTPQPTPSNSDSAEVEPETGVMWIDAIREEITSAQTQLEGLATSLGATEPTAETSTETPEPTTEQKSSDANAGTQSGAEEVVYIDEYLPSVASQVSSISSVPASSVAGVSTTGAVSDTDGENVSVNAPEFEPEAPFKRMRDLKEDIRNGVEATNEATFVTITIPDAQPGQWYYVYVYGPDPEAIGWAQVDEDGKIYVDLAGREAGIYKLSIQDSAGSFVGWGRVELKKSDVELNEDSVTTTTAEPKQIAVRSSIMTTQDWLLILGSLMLVQIAAFLAYARTHRK